MNKLQLVDQWIEYMDTLIIVTDGRKHTGGGNINMTGYP
jgi:hypothetical protein